MSPLLTPDSGDERAMRRAGMSVHESSHAAVALELGFRVTGISVHGNEHGEAFVDCAGPCVERMTVLAAGFVGEAHWLSRYYGTPLEAALQHCESHNAIEDMRQFQQDMRRCGGNRARALDRAATILHTHRARTEHLAALVAETGSVAGADITATLGQR